jgi:hypothetical protein
VTCAAAEFSHKSATRHGSARRRRACRLEIVLPGRTRTSGGAQREHQ